MKEDSCEICSTCNTQRHTPHQNDTQVGGGGRCRDGARTFQGWGRENLDGRSGEVGRGSGQGHILHQEGIQDRGSVSLAGGGGVRREVRGQGHNRAVFFWGGGCHDVGLEVRREETETHTRKQGP